MENGVLYVDKPLGWSSFNVVKRVSNLLGVRKVGHAGTLDPLATGLLILCVGATCKQLSTFQDLPKSYQGLMRLGEQRPSYDLETEISHLATVAPEIEAKLPSSIASFLGTQLQEPPIFSALKVKGRRAYEYARRGEKIRLNPREVHIDSFEALRIDVPWVRFSLRCSKGTYVRSVVHDLGKKLGVGATLHALRRTAIGDIHVKDAYSMSELADNQSILRI